MFRSGIRVLGFPQAVRGAVLRLHPSDLHDEDEQRLPGLSVRDARSRRVSVCPKTVPGQRSARRASRKDSRVHAETAAVPAGTLQEAVGSHGGSAGEQCAFSARKRPSARRRVSPEKPGEQRRAFKAGGFDRRAAKVLRGRDVCETSSPGRARGAEGNAGATGRGAAVDRRTAFILAEGGNGKYPRQLPEYD